LISDLSGITDWQRFLSLIRTHALKLDLLHTERFERREGFHRGNRARLSRRRNRILSVCVSFHRYSVSPGGHRRIRSTRSTSEGETIPRCQASQLSEFAEKSGGPSTKGLRTSCPAPRSTQKSATAIGRDVRWVSDIRGRACDGLASSDRRRSLASSYPTFTVETTRGK
jgi:hypothetical protein